MHHKRRKPRTKSRSVGAFPSGTPAHWNILFHTRPRRRREHSSLVDILRGRDPENMTWDQGNSRPHKYYW